MRTFLVTSESRLFALFAVRCKSSMSTSPSLPPSLSSCRSMWSRSNSDSSISLWPSSGWRLPGISETIRIGAGQIISSRSVPAVWDGLGHDHDRELPLLAEDKLATENNDGPQKISGDALIDPHRMFFDNSSVSDYLVVSIVDPINLKISGDAIKVTLEQKTFEPLKDGYGKFAGSEFPIILIGNPCNLWEQKTLETLKDGYRMFAGSEFPIISIWDIFNLWEQNIFETFNDGHCLFAESEFPTISIGDPFNLWEQKTLETLKDGYCMFARSEFPIISIGDPFNPTISGDALKVMCESFGSGYPVVSIEESFCSMISGDALKDLYKSFVSKYPIVSIEDPFDQDDWEHYSKLTCELETKVQKGRDDLMVTNPKVSLCTYHTEQLIFCNEGELGQMLYMAE